MNYQRRYIERLAERILSFLGPRVRTQIPVEFTKKHIAKFLGIQEANAAEALGLLWAARKIKRVRPGCRAFGPAVYRRG